MGSSPLKCLLLEDSATQAKIISSILGRIGCECVVANSARDYKGNPDLFDTEIDIAFVDINLGGVNGLDLIGDIRKRWSGCVVVVMTADSTDSYAGLSEARERGVNLVLRKPFSMEDARGVVSDAVYMKREGKMRRHIVVIDDSRTCGKVAAGVLTANEYRVSSFEDPHAAIERLSYDRVDVVVTDLIMPNMDGREVIQLVRDVWPEVGLVAMSGGGEKDGANRVLNEAKSLGADSILFKPYGPEELINAVKNAIRKGDDSADVNQIFLDA